MSETEDRAQVDRLRNAERLKFFTDAVVAIALTLLILPLVESVSEAAAERLTTAEFLTEHYGQLIAFVLSFVIIATFWVSHERLFTLVGTWRGPLMALNFGWMLTIVFLPVATAIVGSLPPDNGQLVLYVGTMLASSLFMAGMHLYVRRRPAVWEEGTHPPVGGIAAAYSLVLLFALALVIGLLLPNGSKFSGLFLLFLTGPVQRVLGRALRRRAPQGP